MVRIAAYCRLMIGAQIRDAFQIGSDRQFRPTEYATQQTVAAFRTNSCNKKTTVLINEQKYSPNGIVIYC